MKGKAYGATKGNGFKVFAGSFIAPKVADNMYNIVKTLCRENAKNINEDNILLVDISFDNPGQAARFVTGKQVSGNKEWLASDGTTYKDWSETMTYVSSALDD